MTHREHNPETYAERLSILHELREAAMHSSDSEAKQHDRGKYTARERIDKLLDPTAYTGLCAMMARDAAARARSAAGELQSAEAHR